MVYLYNENQGELQMKDKRYVLELDLYIYAQDDKDAIKQMDDIIKKLHKLGDNDASPLQLNEVPFGSIGNSRKVDIHS